MVSVVIPAFNERRSLDSLLEALASQAVVDEIVLVDDGSEDGTAEIALAAGAKVIAHPYNMGNGAAVKTGIRNCRGDVIVFMDADGQHDPAWISKLIAYLDKYDMVVAARVGEDHASGFRRFGNWLLNRLATYVTGLRIKDLTSGFRAMRAEVAHTFLPLLPNGFSWPTTITLAALRSGYSLKYMPFKVGPRLAGKSRLKPLSGAIRFFMILIKVCTLYSPLKIFLPVSLASLCLGLLNYMYTYLTAGRFTNMSAVLLTTAVIIFMIGLVSEQVSQMSFNRQQPMDPQKPWKRS